MRNIYFSDFPICLLISVFERSGHMAKYCRFCGTQLSESAAFCRRCGKPVKRQEVLQPKPDTLQKAADPLPSAGIQPKIDVRPKSEEAAPSVTPVIEKNTKIAFPARSGKITDSKTAYTDQTENGIVPQTKRHGLNMTLILMIIDIALAVWIILSYLSA